MKFCCDTSCTLPKQSQRSRSILYDSSRFFYCFGRNMLGKPLLHKLCMAALLYHIGYDRRQKFILSELLQICKQVLLDSAIKWVSLSKQSQRSRSILPAGSRSLGLTLGLFWRGTSLSCYQKKNLKRLSRQQV